MCMASSISRSLLWQLRSYEPSILYQFRAFSQLTQGRIFKDSESCNDTRIMTPNDVKQDSL